MIEAITFLNFKALRDTTLPLGRFTLIVGANGSGKSSVFQALRALAQPNQYTSHELTSFGNSPDDGVCVVANWSLDQQIFSAGYRWTPPTVQQIHDGVLPENGLDRTRMILQSFRFYALEPKKIREPVRIGPDPGLHEDGFGLAAVLDNLKDNHHERFEALVAEWNRWMPEYGRIGSHSPQEGTKVPRLITAAGKHFVEARHISDGSLIALGILTLAYLPNPPAVIGFEDPDQGIHPRLLRHVQDALYRLAYPEVFGELRLPVQVIATTHSPYFVDLFKDHPEEVVLIEKHGLDSTFKPLGEHPHLQEVLGGSGLGEIWYSGILGGVPAEP